jgi:hypothetical protein
MTRTTKSADLLDTLANTVNPLLRLERHDDLFVRNAIDGIAFPVAHLLAIFNVAWSLEVLATIGNVSKPVTYAHMPFAPGFLASHVLVLIFSSGLIRVDVKINTIMNYSNLAFYLLGAPLNSKVEVTSAKTLGSTQRALRLHKARSEALTQACSAP